MDNFWDYNVWGFFNLLAILLASLLAGNMVKRRAPGFKESLIPTSVLGGGILIIVAGIYKFITGEVMFDTAFFGNNGTANMELITYHTLALGFIASTFRPAKGKMTAQRTAEIFNTGVTTVATYLLQGILGMAISMIAAWLLKDFFAAAGLLQQQLQQVAAAQASQFFVGHGVSSCFAAGARLTPPPIGNILHPFHPGCKGRKGPRVKKRAPI